MSRFLAVFKKWLPLSVAISALCFVVFLVIQQDIRISGNDPQIQRAEDLAVSLEHGASPITSGEIDISRSLAPFTIIYNQKGEVVSSSALLNGKVPSLPPGALDGNKGTNQPGENRITWQPQEGVRLATVIVRYDRGYILVGRNLREVEAREQQQFVLVFLGWLIGLLATLGSIFTLEILFPQHRTK